MDSKTPGGKKTHIPFTAGGIFLLALALACGGSSNPTQSAPVTPPLAIAVPASLSLPVPKANTYNAPPYVGTATVTVTKTAAVTGPVTMTVTGLPANVKATFAQASTTAATDELSIQAGYADPTDPTFTKQLYPAMGAYPLTITATSAGVTTASATLTLNLVNDKQGFGLGFFTSRLSPELGLSTFTLSGSTPLTTYVGAYNLTTNAYTGQATLAAKGLPSGLTATFDATLVDLDYIHELTFTAQPGLKAGTYGFEITATYNGIVKALPVILVYSPAPFYIEPPFASAGPSVAQGSSITFPVYLGHNDAFYGTVQPDAGTDPVYAGGTQLTVSNLPPGLSATFGNADPTGSGSVPLTISASGSPAAASYTLNLQATRTYGASASVISTLNLPLTVTPLGLSAAPNIWVQAVEWGQTVLKPNLPLVPGKPALLRVQILADRSVPAAAASFTATLQDGTAYPLLGPATVPTSVVEGDLPTATAPSGSTFTALLPATAVQAGMTATISGTGISPVTVTPVVLPGVTLQLTVVPIIHEGLAPTLPTDATMIQELQAFWPVQAVKVAHRAPYTTSTVIPTPPTTHSSATDYSEDGWGQVLSELASLQVVDGATSNYYGFINLNLPATWSGSSVVGLSYIGQGVGFGVDETSAAIFPNPDSPSLDNAAAIMVHEEGHAFNLFHAPAGGAAQPQLNYPYLGADIGNWGFDPTTQAAYDPSKNFDIMSYAPSTHWVSDWDYLGAMGWLGTNQGNGESLAYHAANADQWVVSGWIDPAGQAHLQPLVRTACVAKSPQSGDFHLVIQTSLGKVEVPFAAVQVPDLPAGYRHFTFTVPATGDVTSLDVLSSGSRILRRSITPALASRKQALASGAKAGTLVVRETAGNLHLEWDAALHPWVSVFHEGARRTTLALHLTGGVADLSLDGLESGGRFQVHYSDGLNAVVRATER